MHACLERKRNVPGFSGSFALDDYGSGYSNELNLLELSPRYIKIDISIVRGIDTDRDKQQIVSNIVTYAHARSMQLIAEGIENDDAELRKVIDLGVDLLQGFYLSRPAAVPAPSRSPHWIPSAGSTPGIPVPGDRQQLPQCFPSCQNATALAAATFSESTPWDMGILTV